MLKEPFKRGGFTMAELLIAIGIISLMAAIGLPFYRSISMNLDLNASARDLASDLRQTQQLSVTEQINYRLTIDQENNSYQITNTQTQAVIKNRQINNQITIMSIVGLTDGIAEFNATGAASTTGSIILTNPNLRQATIEIKPSGYVKITN
jgi:prepilin-type N-terminal cleavage/methylation domain-containing protein